MKTAFRRIIIIGLLSTGLPLFGAGKKTVSLAEPRDGRAGSAASEASTLTIDSATSLRSERDAEISVHKIDMNTLTISFPDDFNFHAVLNRFTTQLQGEISLAEVTKRKLVRKTFSLKELFYAVCKKKDSVENQYLSNVSYGLGMQMKIWADCEFIVRLLF